MIEGDAMPPFLLLPHGGNKYLDKVGVFLGYLPNDYQLPHLDSNQEPQS